MFTVKVISTDGNENIMDARSVYAKASERQTSDSPYAIALVLFQTSDGAEVELSGRGTIVYVMNENGKTVSKYVIGVNDGTVSTPS